MDILKDIAELVRDDKEHNVEVRIDSLGLTVYLDYDPNQDFEQQCIIPIHYDAMYQNACIPQEELIEKFKPNEGGIELSETLLACKIMKYMEDHKDYISELCLLYDLADRHKGDK